jgi:regulator of protease activity HflC (stomatin/prohibitin superfamily)
MPYQQARHHHRSRPQIPCFETPQVELKDIQLPDSRKRAMARQAEAEREKRTKIIAAEGESMAAAALGEASDTMMANPQCR